MKKLQCLPPFLLLQRMTSCTMSDDPSSNLFPASNIKQEQIEVEEEDEADSSRLGVSFTSHLS